MKKIILNIAALAAVSLMCVSCNDSFLDRNPTHDLNDNSYWKTESDLEVYNNGIYNEAGNDSYYRFMVGHTLGAWNSISGRMYRLITMFRRVTQTILRIQRLQPEKRRFPMTRLPEGGIGLCCAASILSLLIMRKWE